MIASQIFQLYIIIIVLTLFGLYLSSRISRISSEAKFFRKLFLFSFLLRILLMFGIYLILIRMLPERNGFISGANNDESGYDRLGNTIAQAWREGYNPNLYVPAPGFTYLNAIIYFLFGHNVLIVRTFSSFIGALIPIFVYMITKYAYDEDKIAKAASILIAFLPTTLLYSINHYKEVYVIFTLTFTVWALMKLRRRFNVFLLIAVILTWIYLMSMRFYFGYILLMSAITYIIIGYVPRNQLKVTIVCLITCLIIVKLVGHKLSTGFIYNPIDYIQFRYENVVGSTNVFHSIFSSGNKIATIPLITLYSFLMPYPLWPFLNPYYVSSFDSWLFWIGAVVWYVLMPFSVYGFFLTLKNRNSEMFLLFLISFLTILLLSFSGQGVITAGRIKDSIMPFLMIFAGVGVIDYKREESNISLFLWIYAALLYGSSFLYLYMRLASIGTLFIKASFVVAALVTLGLFLNLLKGRIWR